jgi:16S rRNA (uracil1498-N3)-methyltransferase
MPPRIHVDVPLLAGTDLTLPAVASRHVQVLRLQPGDAITLFDGRGGQWQAAVLAMGRKDVTARLLAHQPLERELHTPVTLALGMPANERMDALVEKATELGVATIAPLVCERSVLRLAGERAERRSAHWQAIAVAACEQCGRNRVPVVHPAIDLAGWLRSPWQGPSSPEDQDRPQRLLLSLRPGTVPLREATGSADGQRPVLFLSGPEGGLSPAEEDLALQHGFAPATLGPRVLRAETAPLAALAALTL